MNGRHWGAGGRLYASGSPKITKNAWIPPRWFLADRKYVRRDIRGLGALARDSCALLEFFKIAGIGWIVSGMLWRRQEPARFLRS